MQEQVYWLGFSLIPQIGNKRLQELYAAFGTLADAWHAPLEVFTAHGFRHSLAERIQAGRGKIDLAYEYSRLQHVNAQLVTWVDPTYPPSLRNIDDAPSVLYMRGAYVKADHQAICIVGTRKPTSYGLDAAYKLAFELAANGVTIISGLAQGIDTATHQAALDAGGRTLAITACGINQVYPQENLPLAHKILEQGAVITEFAIGVQPLPSNFPRRNRILSGLSLGVLVVEAPTGSGALITASQAAEQGREVFAVPHNIFSSSGVGANRLIQDGAKLVTSVEDILSEIHVAYQHQTLQAEIADFSDADAPEEVALLQCLGADPIHVDELVRLTRLPTATVMSTLTILELKGLARSVGNMQYTRSR
ncbi:MAG: DNA-processing protein DprA [Phototrophicaceae bacterium]